MELTGIVISVVAAITYGVSAYLRKTTGPNAEPLDPVLLASTAIIGGVVGLVLAIQGVEPTESNVIPLFGAYAGLTAIIENGIRAVYRTVTKPAATGA